MSSTDHSTNQPVDPDDTTDVLPPFLMYNAAFLAPGEGTVEYETQRIIERFGLSPSRYTARPRLHNGGLFVEYVPAMGKGSDISSTPEKLFDYFSTSTDENLHDMVDYYPQKITNENLISNRSDEQRFEDQPLALDDRSDRPLGIVQWPDYPRGIDIQLDASSRYPLYGWMLTGGSVPISEMDESWHWADFPDDLEATPENIEAALAFAQANRRDFERFKTIRFIVNTYTESAGDSSPLDHGNDDQQA